MDMTGFENPSAHSIIVYLSGGIIRRFNDVKDLSVESNSIIFKYGVDGSSRSVWFNLTEVAGIETIGLEDDRE